MKKLNIVIGHYPDLFYRNGGLQIQIINTYSALKELGHNVKYYYEWLKNRDSIDIYHQFNIDISQHKVLLENNKIAKKVVVSPIFQTISPINMSIIKGMNCIPKLNFQNYTLLKNSLTNVDGYVFLGNNEKREFEKYYDIKVSESCFIPNGIQLDIGRLKSRNDDIVDVNRYVVCVGSICKRKNQKSLITACKELGIPLKLIGPVTEQNYYKECLSEAEGFDVEFLGEMDNQSLEFLKLVKYAEVFCLVSYSEVLPISVFEALGLGTRVVCTQYCSIKDYVDDESVELCDPNSINSIKKSLLLQFNSKQTYNSNLIFEKYSWNNVANNLIKFYNTLLTK